MACVNESDIDYLCARHELKTGDMTAQKEECDERRPGELRRLLDANRTALLDAAEREKAAKAIIGRLGLGLRECRMLAKSIADSRNAHTRVVARGILECIDAAIKEAGL